MAAVLAPAPAQVVDRRKFLGGSDVAAILGISPWRTALDVYLDKTQPRAEVIPPERRKVLDRGKRLEPVVLEMAAAEIGLVVVGRNERYIDPELPFLAAEIDAETAAGENVEIKTVSPFKAREWGEEQTDEIPVHYTAQVQHGLMVRGRPRAIVLALIGADDLRIYRVERDDEAIAAMREREIAFWREHIERGIPPDPANVADLKTLYGRDAGTAIEASEDVVRALNDLRNLSDQMKALGAQAEAAKERIQLFMAEAAILTVGGRPAATWKSQSASRFDQSAFKAAHPDLYEQFKATSESRVFRIK